MYTNNYCQVLRSMIAATFTIFPYAWEGKSSYGFKQRTTSSGYLPMLVSNKRQQVLTLATKRAWHNTCHVKFRLQFMFSQGKRKCTKLNNHSWEISKDLTKTWTCLPILILLTRMHSSRMRTARCSGRPGRGVCLNGGIHLPPPHPVNRITDRYKNITFPQLCLRTVITHGSNSMVTSPRTFLVKRPTVKRCFAGKELHRS